MSTKYQNVNLGAIHPFHEDENISRHGNLFVDEKDLVSLSVLLLPGWNPQLGLCGLYPLSEDRIAAAVVERKATHEAMKLAQNDVTVKIDEKTKIVIGASDRLRSWESSHVNAAGKIIAPKYGVVCAFRRVEAIKQLVNAVLLKQGIEQLLEIPATIKEYVSDLERYTDTIRENTGKIEGARLLSNADTVKAAQKLYHEMATQQTFRQTWKVGMAQKLWAICELDKRFNDVGIVDGLLEGSIAFGPLDKERLRRLHTDADVTEEQVAEYVDNPVRTNKPKMANRTDIEKIVKQFPIAIVAFTASAILDADTNRVNRLLAAKDEINAAVDAILTSHKISLD